MDVYASVDRHRYRLEFSSPKIMGRRGKGTSRGSASGDKPKDKSNQSAQEFINELENRLHRAVVGEKPKAVRKGRRPPDNPRRFSEKIKLQQRRQEELARILGSEFTSAGGSGIDLDAAEALCRTGVLNYEDVGATSSAAAMQMEESNSSPVRPMNDPPANVDPMYAGQWAAQGAAANMKVSRHSDPSSSVSYSSEAGQATRPPAPEHISPQRRASITPHRPSMEGTDLPQMEWSGAAATAAPAPTASDIRRASSSSQRSSTGRVPQFGAAESVGSLLSGAASAEQMRGSMHSVRSTDHHGSMDLSATTSFVSSISGVQSASDLRASTQTSLTSHRLGSLDQLETSHSGAAYGTPGSRAGPAQSGSSIWSNPYDEGGDDMLALVSSLTSVHGHSNPSIYPPPPQAQAASEGALKQGTPHQQQHHHPSHQHLQHHEHHRHQQQQQQHPQHPSQQQHPQHPSQQQHTSGQMAGASGAPHQQQDSGSHHPQQHAAVAYAGWMHAGESGRKDDE
eukprot:Clim_evm37s214 gene=Clim_evmTU37s214